MAECTIREEWARKQGIQKDDMPDATAHELLAALSISMHKGAGQTPSGLLRSRTREIKVRG